MTPLLSVPNISEGRDAQLIQTIARAFDARLLDVHSDPDHNRSVLTLAGANGQLAPAVLEGAREVISRLDLGRSTGGHPRIGTLDVAPIVYVDEGDREVLPGRPIRFTRENIDRYGC